MKWKKTAAVALLAALCAVPGYAAERPKLADGELFVSERVVKDGKVIYEAADAHTDWEHDSEKAVPGLVCTAFIPPKAGQDAPELASIKKLTTQQEKSPPGPAPVFRCILCQPTGALCGYGYQWTERENGHHQGRTVRPAAECDPGDPRSFRGPG